MRYLESTRGLPFYNQDSDPKVAVFQGVGFAYCSLPDPKANALLYGLFQCSPMERTTEAGTDNLHPSTEHSPPQSRWSNPASEATLQSQTHNEKNLARYTSALFERGQTDGKEVRRTDSTLSFNPPMFEVIIYFGTLHASGLGRRKKKAGHLAAKDLCHQLNIEV